jgi:hypothetical protein
MTERSYEKAEGSREEEAGCKALKAKKRNDAGPETAKRCGARRGEIASIFGECAKAKWF